MSEGYPARRGPVELRARSTLLILTHEAFRSSHGETIVVERLPCKTLAWGLPPSYLWGIPVVLNAAPATAKDQ